VEKSTETAHYWVTAILWQPVQTSAPFTASVPVTHGPGRPAQFLLFTRPFPYEHLGLQSQNRPGQKPSTCSQQ